MKLNTNEFIRPQKVQRIDELNEHVLLQVSSSCIAGANQSVIIDFLYVQDFTYHQFAEFRAVKIIQPHIAANLNCGYFKRSIFLYILYINRRGLFSFRSSKLNAVLIHMFMIITKVSNLIYLDTYLYNTRQIIKEIRNCVEQQQKQQHFQDRRISQL